MHVSTSGPLAAAVALALAVAAAPATSTSAPRINGWFPCHDSLAMDKPTTMPAAPMFECAEVEVPLCYEGICKSSKTINIFVKRIPAPKPTKPRKALWFLQGGPGMSSATMEIAMKKFANFTSGAVDMYTLDHRGTGRSNYLECQAAQAFAAGSPSGVEIDMGEIPNCVKDVMFQIDNNPQAFSVTSAAKDVVYLINALNADDAEVYVYGGSYGTYWGSRVMHLAPKQVKGYILDGVVDEKSATFTTWNQNRRFAESRYLKMCEKDKFCSSKLAKEIKAHGSLSAALTALFKTLDSAPKGKNKCADSLRGMTADTLPSHLLRSYLGQKIQNDPTRVVVPALIHRMYNCDAKDYAFLEKVLSASSESGEGDFMSAGAPTAKDLVMSNANLLSSLIKASEMWTTPSPSWGDAMKSYEAGLFSTSLQLDYTMVCFLRGNFKDPVCEHVVKSYPGVDFSQIKMAGFLYKPDAYWHKYASIPSHASAMVINGGLDFQTPSEWGTAEYEGLSGDGEKILVEFDTGVHCAGIMGQTASDMSFCGYRIISSYVLGGGKVGKVDTSCMKTLPAFNFADLNAIKAVFPKLSLKSADELYDSK
ncbi:hypothetical protein PybrP1_011447 [[Pythium] brassicae (nom. inval.)]|nr:hypothetical protein PybrP1_011447 [[Pythium] brassicae (nom. inval.)]